MALSKDKYSTDKQRGTSFATSVYSSEVENIITPSTYPKSADHNPNKSKQICPFCSNLHDLDDCRTFARKSMDDKRAFLMEKRMCFECYGSNHISKDCMKRRTCIKYGKRHPSPMHIENFIMTRHHDDTTPNTHSRQAEFVFTVYYM